VNSKKIIYSIILCLLFTAVFIFGVWIGIKKISYNVPQPDAIDFSLFWDAYNKLKDNFINPSNITNQKILYGAIKGMTDSLGDDYTNFFDPNQAQKFKQDLSGSFDGIGVEIGIKKDLLTIIAPLKGTPGEQAGLRSGDVILKIDNKDATNMTADEAADLIRGIKGTEITLSILREGWNSSKDIKIIRDTIEIPTMDWSLKDENVAYIQIYQFGEKISNDFEQVALEILQSPAKKIILDLRNNPGGYLFAAQEIADWFLERGQIVTIESFGADKPQQIYKTEGGSGLVGYPIVVLINQGSASASEILAAALRENRNVKLIGEKSFGKGSVQEVLELRGGSFLKITIADWLTPKGQSISEAGLTPDISIEITDKDAEDGKDPQLDKALEIIRGLK